MTSIEGATARIARSAAAGGLRARCRAAGGLVALTVVLTSCGGSSKPAGTNSPSVAGSPGSSTASSAPVSESTPATTASSAAASGAPTLPGGSFDFCRLITSDEAQAAAGKPVKTGHRSSSTSPLGPVGGCVYLTKDTSTTSRSLVNVVFLGNKLTRALFDQQVTAKVGSQAQPVPGLGEKAIYFTGIIAVFDHGIALTVQIVKDNVPGSVATLTGLAHKALDRAGDVR